VPRCPSRTCYFGPGRRGTCSSRVSLSSATSQ
jgi:hypothetical protein